MSMFQYLETIVYLVTSNNKKNNDNNKKMRKTAGYIRYC